MSILETIQRSSQRNRDAISEFFGIEKAEKDISKLVKKVVTVTRGGKTFQQTVYVSPETGEKEETPIGGELTPEVKGMDIKKYSEKALLITGDTYVNIDTLKKIKNDIGVGSWNQSLKGWIFPIKFLEVILGYIWSDLKSKGEDEKANAVQNQKNAGLNNGDKTNIQGIEGKIDKNVSDSEGTKYNVTLNDGTKLDGVDEKVMDKNPEKDDKKISDVINNTTPESRVKSEKQIYGIKSIKNIHQYSLQEYMKMHGLSQEDIDKVIDAFKNPKTKKEANKRVSGGGVKKEYTGKEIEGLTKRQLIGKLIYNHYQAVKKAIEKGEKLQPKVLELYNDLKEAYSNKRKQLTEEHKRKISEALKKNKVEEVKARAQEIIDNMSEEDIKKLKSSFSEAKNKVIKEEQDKLADLLLEKDKLDKENKKLWEEIQSIQDFSKQNEKVKSRGLIRGKLDSIILDIRKQKNKVQAIENGGDLATITDQLGVKYNELPDFRNINTSQIEYNIDTILTEDRPKYIPEIDEDKFKRGGYIFDTVKIGDDSYLLATNKHTEHPPVRNEKSGGLEMNAGDYDSEFGGYVVLTLDQLVLTQDYYTTKEKANFKKRADDRNKSALEYWNKQSDKAKEYYLMQKGLYRKLPAKVKKEISEEKWNNMTWQEREKYYKPIKHYGVERLKSKFDEHHMAVSFHSMYERFVNKEAQALKKDHSKLKLGEQYFGQVYANPEVWKSWEYYRETLDWKINDFDVQREEMSDIRKKALETSYGDVGTSDVLLNDYGIKVKRQNGDDIGPKEVEQLKNAWESVQKNYGKMKNSAKESNLKLSHAGETYMYASKSIGMYVPDYKTIGVTAKLGTDQLGFTMGHETAHWIDHMIGEKNGKRYGSNNYDSTAGKIAITLRRNMNKKSDSKYLNSTHECFARALEQYHTIETSGYNALIFGEKPIVSHEFFVNKDVYDNQLKPLIQQFLQENKEILKSLEFSIL